jgi:hypothetical protein
MRYHFFSDDLTQELFSFFPNFVTLDGASPQTKSFIEDTGLAEYIGRNFQ